LSPNIFFHLFLGKRLVPRSILLFGTKELDSIDLPALRRLSRFVVLSAGMQFSDSTPEISDEMVAKILNDNQGCQMVYFRTRNTKFGKILEGLATGRVGILYVRLVYFTAIWYILCLFGIFSMFWYVVPKNLATLTPT
jgi:hypothetical protein